MTDEFEALAQDERLCRLLRHYDDEDRTAWRDRVMTWEDGTPQDVVRWHGALLASCWIEQNTGHVPHAIAGQVPACYRLTRDGRSALKKVG
ncbi:MAG: hypothetical protein U0746_13880 [Gemmataceae bacterium]